MFKWKEDVNWLLYRTDSGRIIARIMVGVDCYKVSCDTLIVGSPINRSPPQGIDGQEYIGLEEAKAAVEKHLGITK